MRGLRSPRRSSANAAGASPVRAAFEDGAPAGAGHCLVPPRPQGGSGTGRPMHEQGP